MGGPHDYKSAGLLPPFYIFLDDMKPTPDLLEYSLATELARKVGPGLKLKLTDNRRSMITVVRETKTITVRLSRIFVMADKELVADLADYISGKTPKVTDRVRSFINKGPTKLLPPPKKKLKLKTKGDVYDIQAIAARLNKEYFDGKLGINISWGRSVTPRKKTSRRRSIQYGSYDASLDLVRIHPALDSDFVPVEFLESVVYHEMLHKKLGVDRNENGRRMLHTSEFKQLERAYEHFKTAEAWEEKNFLKLLRSLETKKR